MALKTEWVRYGDEMGYLAAPPSKTPLPAVIVIQEAWGVDAHIEDVVNRIALAGYVALAPDVFAVKGARPAPLAADRMKTLLAFVNEAGPLAWDPKQRDELLAKKPEAEAKGLRETFEAMMGVMGKMPSLVPGLVHAAKWLRNDCPASRGKKVAAIGFCMGGALAGLLAAHDPDLALAAIYYGRSPSAEDAAKIKCPVFGFYGASDEHVNGTIPAFEAAMKANGKHFEATFYASAGHAFMNDNRPSYNADATRAAFARTLSELHKALG